VATLSVGSRAKNKEFSFPPQLFFERLLKKLVLTNLVKDLSIDEKRSLSSHPWWLKNLLEGSVVVVPLLVVLRRRGERERAAFV